MPLLSITAPHRIRPATGESVSLALVRAANRISLKQAGLPATYLFQPVAIDTLGPLDPSACGGRPQMERQEAALLFQRLPMAIQSFNLVAANGTFPSATE